ncbi:MAG: class I SAM-dependent methyltransferase [Pseudomonadota bacterium]
MAFPRMVLPEILDDIEPQDPRAVRSRLDLRRIHRAMCTISILRRAADRLRFLQPPRRILELGGGDATLVLRLAQALQPAWPGVSLTVLDNHDIVSAQTRSGYAALGWELHVLQQDALQWAAQPGLTRYDLCLCNLFLHHFESPALSRLTASIASTCNALIACEPRRNGISLSASRMVGLLGSNRITREDAVTSVVAGFRASELTALWLGDGRDWSLEEYPALPFSHCFIAIDETMRLPGPQT